MKTPILALLFSFGLFTMGVSQCTPDPLYADSVFGVWPDTMTNFPPAVLNQGYFAQIDILVPNNASLIPGFSLPPLPIDSGSVETVLGLPAGLTYTCNSQTSNDCTFLASQQGCATITGIPTETGTFILNLDLVAHLVLLGSPISVPIAFDGYRIVVTEEPLSIEDLNRDQPGLYQNKPNPFKASTIIPFYLHRNEVVKLRVMDMLGQEVDFEEIQGKRGDNNFIYQPEGLESGIYLYSIETSAGIITKRMIYGKY